jgi:polyisoprenoid-binding protein YceI
MSRHRRLLLSLSLLLLLGGAATAAGVWYFFFNGQAPAAANLDEAAGSLTTPSPGVVGDPGGPVAVDGTWTVDTTIGSFSDYSSSYAGFRVEEVLDNIGDAVAVGRTPDVSGELTLSGGTLSATAIEVQLTTITSDRPRRDPAIQQSLQTSSFPTATFELTEPIALPSTPTEGASYDVTAKGNLTIHGVAQPVEIALQAKLLNGVIVVVGTTPFTFSEFGLTPPRAPVVLSVADHGTIEFQLFFTKADG